MNRHGVILIEPTEIIFRIYQTNRKIWKLYHYHSATFTPSHPIETGDILEVIGEFFSTEYAQHIVEWKICSRHIPRKLIQEASRALDIEIEEINLLREQELLCKGMFTELW